jgi:hypothetical protein
VDWTLDFQSGASSREHALIGIWVQAVKWAGAAWERGRVAHGQRCDENEESLLVAPLGARAILSMWAPVRRWPARRAPTATKLRRGSDDC